MITALITGPLLWSALALANSSRLPDTGEAWYASGRAHLAERAPTARARNVILFVGDGMGVSTVTAARILDGQLRGVSGERNLLSFEHFPHLALVKVYNTDQQVPDSAGTITAMLAGVKTSAGVIGVGPGLARGDATGVATGGTTGVSGAGRAHRVRSIFEECEERGFRTGVVTNARVTHATPAGAYAHVAERDWESDSARSPEARAADLPDIALQLVTFEFGDGLDVVFGGGRGQFLPRSVSDPVAPRHGLRTDGRNLLEEWRGGGARRTWVSDRAGMLALTPTEGAQALGLFSFSHMAYEVDRGSAEDPAIEPSLMEMTTKAIELLASDEGRYLLMVEAGRIDHGHHAGNAYRALTETVELSRAVEAAVRTASEDTLIVVTADHSHTLTIGGYPTLGNDILGLVHENGASGARRTEPALDMSGRPYTTLGYTNGPGYTGATDAHPEGPEHAGRPDLTRVDTADRDYLQEAAIPLESETHAGEDVPLYATGPGSELVRGVIEQHVVYHTLVRALGLPADEVQAAAFED